MHRVRDNGGRVDTVFKLILFAFILLFYSPYSSAYTVYCYSLGSGNVCNFDSYQSACDAYSVAYSAKYPNLTVSSHAVYFTNQCRVATSTGTVTGFLSQSQGTCSSGLSKNLTQFQSSSSPQSIYIGSGPNLSDGFCEYSCSSATTDGKTYYNDSGSYNTYSCKSTGQEKLTSTPTSKAVPSDAKSVTPTPPTNINGSSCTQSSSGSTVCVGGTIPTGCFTSDGSKVCPNGAGTTIDDKPVSSTDSKNCVSNGSSSLCNVPVGDPKAQYCGTVNGVQTCFSKTAVNQSSSTTTTSNPDVTTTTTTIKTNNVVDGGQQIITRTTDTTGKVTETTTGTLNAGPSALDSANLAAIASNTAKGANNAGLSDCQKNPNTTLGCMQPGTSDNTEPPKNHTEDIPFTPESWSSTFDQCPSPKPIKLSNGLTFELSWSPLCTFAVELRPIIHILFLISATLIILAGFTA